MARWDDVADRMIERYKGIASRLVIYLASHWREVDPQGARTLGRGGARGEEGGVDSGSDRMAVTPSVARGL